VAHFGFDRTLSSVYGAEFDGTRGDKADLLRYAMAEEGLAADECVMVGDRSYDIKGALEVGATPIGVLWGYGDRAELIAAGCPEENLVKVGLIRLEEDRVFPMQLAVSDAEYVYRPMAANMRPATYTYNPYFAATFEKDTFAGVTNYWGAKQFNAFCTVHFDYDAYDKGELKGYLGVYSLAEAPGFHPHAILPSVTPKPEDEDSDEFED
jgi:hypothetical protein